MNSFILVSMHSNSNSTNLNNKQKILARFSYSEAADLSGVAVRFCEMSSAIIVKLEMGYLEHVSCCSNFAARKAFDLNSKGKDF